MKKIIYYLKRVFSLNYGNAFKTINKISKRSNKSRVYIFFDIIICSIKYSSGYVDYDLFHFEELNSKERNTFVTRGINNEYIKLLNNRNYYNYFDDKELFNEKFKEFVKRDYINISKCRYEDFENFVNNHLPFIAKPLNLSGGFGVEKYVVDSKTDMHSLYDKLLKNNQYLLEEEIKQSKFMNDIYPYSVNTLRIVTIRKDNKTFIVHRVIRIGNNYNIVDNFHKDGMYSVVDENGIIIDPAIDRNGKIFVKHPITNFQIQNYVLPNFDKIEEFCIKASEVIPQVGYVGWDVAITDNGPVLVEGNNLPGYDLYQSKINLSKKTMGLKPKFDSIIYKNKYKRDNKFSFFIALILGKTTKFLLRILNKKVPYYPGVISLKICPNYFKYLNMPKEVISITGTNGKSTVCKMLNDFFISQNMKVVSNNGFNTIVGITSFLTDSVSIFNKQKFNVAIIETDELTSKKIFESIKPNYIVVTNLFRDSIKRNANPEYIRNILKESIPSKTKLLLNADDLLTCSLENDNTVYFGIGKLLNETTKNKNIVCDLVLCPKCGEKLTFEYYRYNHIGKCKCNNCGYGTPKPKYEITNINYDKNYFILNGEIYNFMYLNLANFYNVLTAISLLREMKFTYKAINISFKNIKLLDSRFSKFEKNGKELISVMAKGQNPIAVSQAFELISKDNRKKEVILILDDVNDKKDSCEIISWLYDSDFEFLNSDTIDKIIVGGVRSKDYLLRLLLAGIEKNKIEIAKNEMKIVDLIDYNDTKIIYLVHDIFACDLAKTMEKRIQEKL